MVCHLMLITVIVIFHNKHLSIVCVHLQTSTRSYPPTSPSKNKILQPLQYSTTQSGSKSSPSRVDHQGEHNASERCSAQRTGRRTQTTRPSSKRKMLSSDKKIVSMPYSFMTTNSFNKNVIDFVVNEISFNEKVVTHCLLNQ